MATNKRSRNDGESADILPETKRFREADLILDILDDDDDVGAADCLADVIKSLEDEIAAAPMATEQAGGPPPELGLGYLLEASDDELGIPPAAGCGDVVEISDGETEAAGFDRIWGFEDDVAASPYDGLFELGVDAGFDDGVNFDGCLFDYPEAEELPWLTESLTAV